MFRSVLALALFAMPAFADPDEEEDIDLAPAPARMRMSYEFADFDVAAEGLGATVGGAQDVGHFRDLVARGEIPMPESFTTEGLFSEHDLPLDGPSCEPLLCTNARAVPVRLDAQPDVRAMVQLGFTSGLTSETFRRAPLHLVAVVDQSGSMGGPPIETVRATLDTLVAKHLDEGDQLSIVLYGSGTTEWLAPTPVVDKAQLRARIAAIPIDGSTHMEAGLQHGFRLAREADFDGVTRVMLFTDERPNTGATDKDSFMGLARDASHAGIGMTTVGVGVQFGAELAQQVSAVRGGNLVFLGADPTAIEDRMEEDFDTLVTELAYDLEVKLEPAPGWRLAGLYGVPGDAVQWSGDQLTLEVETLFLSRNQGGIFVALAPEEGQKGRSKAGVAHLSLAYTPRDGARVEQVQLLTGLEDPSRLGEADMGLIRGPLLVDEATTLIEATRAYHQRNDPETAWQLIAGLRQRLEAVRDAELEPERDLVRKLEELLAFRAGRQGEGKAVAGRDPATGLPIGG